MKFRWVLLFYYIYMIDIYIYILLSNTVFQKFIQKYIAYKFELILLIDLKPFQVLEKIYISWERRVLFICNSFPL